MFEATLHTYPDRERQQRLTLAAAITIASTMTAFASVWTLDQLGIDRVNGPSQKYELLQFSLLTPPKPIDPPPPPPDDSTGSPDPVGKAAAFTLEERIQTDDDPAPSDALTQPKERSSSIPGDRGIPGPPGCPTCIGITAPSGPGKPCIGPLCTGSSSTSSPVSSAPKEVEFSALRCLACGDPDQAALRKTVAAGQKRSGTVTVKFCVDLNGRVEDRSIKVSRSFGVPAVDRITTEAMTRWRFSPLEVGGKPRRACSRAEFNIRFE
jgi:periplasmic protein TonB